MRLLLSILFILSFASVTAQFVLTDSINLAQELIMELRFKEARAVLNAEESARPNNGMLPYLKSNMVFLSIFISNDPSTYEQSVDSLQALIKQVKENNADTLALYKFTLSEMHFELGTLHMLFGNNWKSAWAMLDAFGYIKDNRQASSLFLPQQLADGVLNVSMGSMPAKYRWLTNMLGYNGDVEVGLSQLKAATVVENTPYASFKKKSTFVYSYIKFFLEADETFNVYDVDANYTNSPLLVYTQARIYRERGENDKLIELLSGRKKENRLDFYYLDYMLGKAMLNKLHPDADASFLTFLNQYPGENSVKSAYRYLSWHYYLRGNKALSAQYREYALTKGSNKIGADKQAVIDMSKPINSFLLKGQLYFDGGYYQKALDVLASGTKSYKTASEKINYHYRLGRIYQRTNESAAAIQAYKHLLGYEESENTFEFGNSALQLGVIFEELGQFKKAKDYYDMALASEDYPFEDGIHQKAKAGLARIKAKQ